MRLSQIISFPSLFQLRETAHSQATVDGICAEGIDLAKWSDLPVIPAAELRDAGHEVPEDTWVVGGDGHSRAAAARLLAKTGRLPEQWKAGDDWEIPCKVVTLADAQRLMLANLCRDDLTPGAEARGFELMKSRGMDEATIAVHSHKSEDYVRRMMKLNTLCSTIRERIGKSSDAGGIDKTCAMVLADEFKRHNIGVQQQQELYTKVLAHSELTPNFIRGLLKKVGPAMKQRAEENALFALPPSIKNAVKDAQGRAKELKRVLAIVSSFVNIADSTVLDSMPELRSAIKAHGPAAISQLQYEADADAASIGKMVMVS